MNSYTMLTQLPGAQVFADTCAVARPPPGGFGDGVHFATTAMVLIVSLLMVIARIMHVRRRHSEPVPSGAPRLALVPSWPRRPMLADPWPA